MFVYWGYWDSGKGHMKKYAKMNSKTVIFYDNNSMRKIQTNESNIKKTTYYYDNEFISEVTRTKFNPDKRKYRPYIERESGRWRKFERYGNESLTHDQLSGHYDTIFDGGDIFLMTHLLPEFFIVASTVTVDEDLLAKRIPIIASSLLAAALTSVADVPIFCFKTLSKSCAIVFTP